MQALRAPLLALALVLASTPVSAQQTKDPQAEVERLTREAAQRIIAALGVILQSIPQYDLPEIQPNGDIIIRRRNPPVPEPPKKKPPAPPKPEDDQTDT